MPLNSSLFALCTAGRSPQSRPLFHINNECIQNHDQVRDLLETRFLLALHSGVLDWLVRDCNRRRARARLFAELARQDRIGEFAGEQEVHLAAEHDHGQLVLSGGWGGGRGGCVGQRQRTRAGAV